MKKKSVTAIVLAYVAIIVFTLAAVFIVLTVVLSVLFGNIPAIINLIAG